jgi:hypothetical protein
MEIEKTEHSPARRWIEQREFGLLWATSAALGVLSILLTQTDQKARLVTPVGIMLGYAWLGYKRIMLREAPLRWTRIAQLADSLYFLGFLWTLFALILALVFSDIRDAEGVFRVFGYALVTTAFGMFLRLFILQLSYSTEDQTEEAKLTASQQLQEFAMQLNQSALSIANFGNIASESAPRFKELTDGLDANLSAMRERLGTLEASIEQIHREGMELVHESARSAAATLAQDLRPILTLSQTALKQCLTTISTTGESLQKQIRESEQSIVANTKTLAASSQALATASSDLLVAARSNQDLKAALSDLTAKIRDGSDGIQQELGAAADRIRKLNASWPSISEQTKVASTSKPAGGEFSAPSWPSSPVPGIGQTSLKGDVKKPEKAPEGMLARLREMFGARRQ